MLFPVEGGDRCKDHTGGCQCCDLRTWATWVLLVLPAWALQQKELEDWWSNGLAMTASEAADAASQPVPKCKDGCLLLVAMSGAHESLSAGIGMRLPIVEWKSETSSL